MPLPYPPKLYLNEHLSPRLAAQLRRYGFDAISSQESKMLSQEDDKQLDLAVREQRAIVTFNFSDFFALHENTLRKAKSILASSSQPKNQ